MEIGLGRNVVHEGELGRLAVTRDLFRVFAVYRVFYFREVSFDVKRFDVVGLGK